VNEHRTDSTGVVTPAGRRTAVPLAIAGLVANIVIILTGTLVRLTGSGLGCPTWPRCTDDSFVATPEMGVHGVVEFANRVVGIAVGLITLLMLIAVLRHRPRPRPATALAIGTLALVVAQGFVGGLSVRQELAPEIVAVHFLVSMIIVAGVTVLVDVLRRPGARLRTPEHRGVAWLVAALPVVLTAVLVLGTLVTGSGPHAGDEGARRFGFDPAALSHLHADAVLVFLALQIAALVALRMTGASSAQRGAALLLLGASLVQAAIGYTQYAFELPVPLAAVHVLGAALLTCAVTHLFVMVWRDRSA
jgi:cytochrome c oxidase assembly protein subunit 15